MSDKFFNDFPDIDLSDDRLGMPADIPRLNIHVFGYRFRDDFISASQMR